MLVHGSQTLENVALFVKLFSRRARKDEWDVHAMQEDSSVTRSDAYMLDLLKRSGYTLLGSALQRNFPKGLFKVQAACHVQSSAYILRRMFFCCLQNNAADAGDKL